jgi:hypothetical protein
VEKRRTLRLFQVGNEGQVVPLPTGSHEGFGCGLELTRIVVRGADWWSLGLEAFGPEATLEKRLMAVAGHLFALGAAPRLEAEASYGYPRWLAQTARAKEASVETDA